MACATIDLLLGKIRFLFATQKPKDGDLTKERFIIVHELDDIKRKIDRLSQHDLLKSIYFLQEGVQYLLTRSLDSQTSSESGSSAKNPTMSYEDALANARRLNVGLDEVNVATGYFREAGNFGRRAFHNEALAIKDRILASKARIASGILEHLEDPEVAASDCLYYLKELHDAPAIRAIFSVYLGEGIRARLRREYNREKRAELVEAVRTINLVLIEFIFKFTKRRMAVFDWPMIKCGIEIIHPLYCYEESVPNLKTPPWYNVELKEESISSGVFNSKGDLVCFLSGKDDKHGLGKLSTATDKVQLFPPPPLRNVQTENIQYCCVTVDEDDRVYVLSWYDGVGYKLSVYTEDGVIKHHCELNVHIVRQSCCIAVTKDKKIVICGKDDCGQGKVYLCRISEDQEPQIQLLTLITDLWNHMLEHVFVSSKNEIIVTTINVTKQSHVLYIYTEDGQLQRTVEFHPSKGSNYVSVCYNQDNIIGFSVANHKILVEYLSAETGKPEHIYLLSPTNFPENIRYFHLVCHTNGTLALIDDTHIILLRKM